MAEPKKQTAIAKQDPTASEQFTGMVIKEFSGLVGEMNITPHQKRLAQHLFIKIDASLKQLETKRFDKTKQPIVWRNVNMIKLAIDCVHRVDLGLDALIPNHISPIPYWNSKEAKYDLDLRVGYVGKDFYRRKAAIEEPLNIIYELVYSTDKFKPLKKSLANPIDSYEFEITNPFDRGEVIGGFGYIMYADSQKNLLVLVTGKVFEKFKRLAKAGTFWEGFPVEMRYKTLVLRTTDKLSVDPDKIGESYQAVEQDETAEAEVVGEIAEKANKEVLNIEEPEKQKTETTEAETGEIIEKQTKPKRDPKTIKTIDQMCNACWDDFGLDKPRVCKELGVLSMAGITDTPADCYLQIAAVRDSEPEEEPGF